MKLRIIDVSEHQGKIDWEKVKPHIDGAIIRTGYGDDDREQDDKYAIYNMTKCAENGIPFATYLYSYADSDAHIKSEIAHEKRMTWGKDVMHFLDSEERGISFYWDKAFDAWRKAFPKSGAYSWEWAFWQHIKGEDVHRWICAYGSNSGKPEEKYKPKSKCDGWQFTSKGNIPGIKGNVDVSEWYVPFGECDKPKEKPTPERRPVYKKEVAAIIMRHLCTHHTHGYTQNMERRQGTGTEEIDIYGHKYIIKGGDRDCSSAVISAYEAAGISCGGATYTGNMCSCMLKSGNFKWRPMSFIAQMGDTYLNIKSHTAMCMSAEPDILAEFSIDENGGVEGRKSGDQKQHGEYDETHGRGESHLAFYYDYPWDGILECINDEVAFYVGGESNESFPFPEKSDDELAVEVMFNRFGTNDERRHALMDRYDAVQKRVTFYWKSMPDFIKAVASYLDKYGQKGLKKDGA